MGAFRILHVDHNHILVLLDEMESQQAPGAGAGEQRRRQIMDLVMAESRHAAVEEEIVWPVVRENVEDGDALAATVLSHERQARELLKQLESCEAGTAECETVLAEFARVARERIAFEEQHLWPMLADAITTEQSADLGRRLAAAVGMAPTQ